MIDFLKSFTTTGVKSKRLASVVFGTVLFAWLVSFFYSLPMPEIPMSVLLLLVITAGVSVVP